MLLLKPMSVLKRLGVDTFLILLFAAIVLAILLPVSGEAARLLSCFAKGMIGLLFFLYGVRLDPASIVAGMRNWKLQGAILLNTFLVFPLLAVGLTRAFSRVLEPDLIAGLLFLSVLPSTIQSSIALTGLAQGNVPAAICGASLSNLIGVLLTPILVGVLLHANGGGGGFDGIVRVAMQILLPFALGQIARPWIFGWVSKHNRLTQVVDRGSIALIVYSAFSAGSVAGIWQDLALSTLVLIVVANSVLLGLAMLSGLAFCWAAGMSSADRITVLLCGATKSLASGLLIANVLFGDRSISVIILPAMIFHQLQIVVSSLIARRAARRVDTQIPAQ